MKFNSQKRNNLRLQKATEGIYRVKECSDEEYDELYELFKNEKSLPEDIIWRTVNGEVEFFRMETKEVIDLTYIEEPLQEIRKWRDFIEWPLYTIKNWVTFLGVINLLGIIAGIILVVYFFNGLK